MLTMVGAASRQTSGFTGDSVMTLNLASCAFSIGFSPVLWSYTPNSNSVTWLLSGRSSMQPAFLSVSMTDLDTLRLSMSS